MKCIARWILKQIILFLIHARLLDKTVIIYMDGGICSQIHFFLIGLIFEENGYKVKYDISWFSNVGKDLNGTMERNFDLLKLFPYLDFSVCSSIEKWFYAKAFLYKNSHTELIDPLKYLELNAMYLRGYFSDPDWLYSSYLAKYLCLDKVELDNENQNLLSRIKSVENSVAVHIRRGDLSGYNPVYGKPASIDYFINAIMYIKHQYNDAYYFFFSDEPDWVEEFLIKKMPLDENYHIININGSGKGYLDLVLISFCRHQITSKGSLAKYGSLFAKSESQIVTLCNDQTEYVWKIYLNNAVLIKC